MVDIEDVDQLPSGAVPVDQPTSQPIEEVNQLPEGAVPTSEELIENVDQLPPGAVPADQSQSDAERYAGVGNTIAASLEGIPFAGAVLKGVREGAAALGFTDQGWLNYIAPSAEEMAGRAAAHPVAGAVGNIAGTIAELSGTGATALLGTAPEVGAVESAIRGGAELGSFQGLATAADDWSQDKPLDAEKIMASVGIGAAFGAAGPLFGAAAKGVSKGLGWIDEAAKNALPGEGLGGQILKGYQAASEDPAAYTRTLTDNLNDLYEGAEKATTSMYEDAGQRAIGEALTPTNPLEESVSLGEARTLATNTIDKIIDLTVPGEGEAPVLQLSPGTAGYVTSKVQAAADAIKAAETPLDVHNALSDLATNIDKGIKFDKIPTAANQVDQEIIRNVRGVVRGDLRDPELWGQTAADVYGQLTDNYSAYKTAQKNFARDFMKSRTSPNGTTIKVVDPVKINNFFKDPEAPGQQLKQASLDAFVEAAQRNYRFANNYGTYQDEAVKFLVNREVRARYGLERTNLEEIRKAVKKGEIGLGSLAVIETLPAPLRAKFFALRRYVNPKGGLLFGGDLSKFMEAGRWMADTSDRVGERVQKGARSIFRAGASEERE